MAIICFFSIKDYGTCNMLRMSPQSYCGSTYPVPEWFSMRYQVAEKFSLVKSPLIPGNVCSMSVWGTLPLWKREDERIIINSIHEQKPSNVCMRLIKHNNVWMNRVQKLMHDGHMWTTILTFLYMHRCIKIYDIINLKKSSRTIAFFYVYWFIIIIIYNF